MANMNFFFVKNSWYFIVAEWPTGPGGEDKIKHNGATDLQASNFANLTLIFLFFYYYLKCKNTGLFNTGLFISFQTLEMSFLW